MTYFYRFVNDQLAFESHLNGFLRFSSVKDIRNREYKDPSADQSETLGSYQLENGLTISDANAAQEYEENYILSLSMNRNLKKHGEYGLVIKDINKLYQAIKHAIPKTFYLQIIIIQYGKKAVHSNELELADYIEYKYHSKPEAYSDEQEVRFLIHTAGARFTNEYLEFHINQIPKQDLIIPHCNPLTLFTE